MNEIEPCVAEMEREVVVGGRETVMDLLNEIRFSERRR